MDEIIFKDCDKKEFYGDSEEEIPPNAHKPRVKDVDLRSKVDSDHTGDKETRQSCTGYLIFCNMYLVDWLYKKQPMIEKYVFGADFVALKHMILALRGIFYKLRMMGVPLYG